MSYIFSQPESRPATNNEESKIKSQDRKERKICISKAKIVSEKPLMYIQQWLFH